MNHKVRAIIKESYDNSIKFRDKSEIVDWKIKEMNKVLNAINDRGLKVLDLGAGSGIYANYFKNHGLDVTCIDLSESMVNLCKEKRLKAFQMDFYDLEFDDNSFDIVWSLNTLLHVPKNDIGKIFNNIKRVLKPDGVFYMGVYGGKNFEGIWEEDFYKPKRFFSFYVDSDMKRLLDKYFNSYMFESFDVGGNRENFQSIIIKNT